MTYFEFVNSVFTSIWLRIEAQWPWSDQFICDIYFKQLQKPYNEHNFFKNLEFFTIHERFQKFSAEKNWLSWILCLSLGSYLMLLKF